MIKNCLQPTCDPGYVPNLQPTPQQPLTNSLPDQLYDQLAPPYYELFTWPTYDKLTTNLWPIVYLSYVWVGTHAL